MRKKNWKLRILGMILFLSLSSFVMVTIYHFSAENGFESTQTSEMVSEKIKQEVKTKLNDRGLRVVDKIKYYVILHSPYGSDWNANLRKFAHFSLYFFLSCMLYVSFAILGAKKTWRLLLVVVLCFLFALADEYHQSFSVGRGSSMSDVLLDTSGALTAGLVMTTLSWLVIGIKKFVDHCDDAYDAKES